MGKKKAEGAGKLRVKKRGCGKNCGYTGIEGAGKIRVPGKRRVRVRVKSAGLGTMREPWAAGRGQ